MQKVLAPVDYETLKWAREMAGFSEEDATEKISFLKEKRKKGENAVTILREWETGQMKPFLVVAREMAKIYDRSLSFLYLPIELARENENDEPLKLKDFRRSGAKQLTPNTIKFLREVKRKQEWASAWLKDNGFPKSDLVGKFSDFSNKMDVEQEKECVKYIFDRFFGNKKRRLTFESWISRIEEKSEIIIMQSRLHPAYKVGDEFSGCAIKDDYAPVIALNYSEREERKLFTLMHELAHLLIGKDGVSKIEFRTEYDQQDKVEAYCNRIAAQVLMPEEAFEQKWNEESGNIKEVAKFFRVSLSATVIRAHRLGSLSKAETNSKLKLFRRIREENERKIQKEKEKRRKEEKLKKGKKKNNFRDYPHLNAIERAGDKLTKEILTAYNDGEITSSEVSRLLNVKLQYLEAIAEKQKISLGRWSSNSESR